MNRKQVGIKIKEERDKLNWSQETLASEVKLSLRTIQRIEKGEESINKDTLLQVMNFLSIEYCEEGYISIPEISSIGIIIENLSKYKTSLKRGDFEIRELKLLLEFVDYIDSFVIYSTGDSNFTFRENIEREIRLREILEEIEKNDIKIFYRLRCDSEINDNRDEGYGIYKDNYFENQLYIYIKTDKNVFTKKNKSAYINVENTDYSNLKNQRFELGIRDEDIKDYENLFTKEELENYSINLSQEDEKFPF